MRSVVSFVHKKRGMQPRFLINGQGVRLNQEIEEYLDSGRYLQLLTAPSLVRKIDFAHELVRESFNTCPYEIMWHTEIPASAKQLVCLFPNHEDRSNDRKHVLKVSSYWGGSLAALNKEINKRFKASLEYTDGGGRSTKFAVCYGQHIYICSGIAGNIYILWARHVNRTNHGNTPNTLFQDVPIIVNTNGRMRVCGLYILREQVLEDADLLRIPLMEDSPVFLQDKDVDLFVCEIRDTAPPALSPMEDQKGYALLTRKSAMARILAPTPAVQKQQQQLSHALSEGTSVDWEQNAYVDLQLIHEDSKEGF